MTGRVVLAAPAGMPLAWVAGGGGGAAHERITHSTRSKRAPSVIGNMIDTPGEALKKEVALVGSLFVVCRA